MGSYREYGYWGNISSCHDMYMPDSETWKHRIACSFGDEYSYVAFRNFDAGRGGIWTSSGFVRVRVIGRLFPLAEGEWTVFIFIQSVDHGPLPERVCFYGKESSWFLSLFQRGLRAVVLGIIIQKGSLIHLSRKNVLMMDRSDVQTGRIWFMRNWRQQIASVLRPNNSVMVMQYRGHIFIFSDM